MLRSSLHKTGSQLLKAGCSTRSVVTSSQSCPLISFTASRNNSPASKRRPLAISTQRRYAAATVSAPDTYDNFLSGSTANYIDEMYLQWKEDPKSVHVSWQVYFKNMESGDMPMSQAFQYRHPQAVWPSICQVLVWVLVKVPTS